MSGKDVELTQREELQSLMENARGDAQDQQAPPQQENNNTGSPAAAAASSSSPAPEAAASSVTSTDNETFASTLLSLPMHPAVFGGCAVLSALVTVHMIHSVQSNPTFYTQRTADKQPAELSAGQIMAFLVCFFACILFGGVQLMVMKNYLSALVLGNRRALVASGGGGGGGGDDAFGFPAIIPDGAGAAASSSSEYVLARRAVISDKKYDALSAGFQFCLCLLLFFLCDRTTFLQRGKKHYSRDQFWFLCAIFLLVGLGTLQKAPKPKSKSSEKKKEAAEAPATTNETNAAAAADSGAASAATTTAVVSVPTPSQPPVEQPAAAAEDTFEIYHVPHLQRDQTEEWKGWMQVMFLWYHYFDAKEIYNVIRLYIAAYVWMTGFGNFSYYYIRKDFSFLRFCSMQWRLNFLVFWVCLLMQNEYMLYYICMLHTTFTVFIYIALGIYPQANQSFYGCCAKFAAVTVFSVLVWDISDGVFDMVWLPFKPLVQFHNPVKPSQDPMHEWRFRSKLDHLVWIFGMICAFNHPTWDGLLKKVDNMAALPSNLIKGAVVVICLVLLHLYNERVFQLPKLEYNALHPYTSFIPIFLFIVLRNISQTARMYHIHMFEWLGKITLETYISQYHVWMGTTGINGSPKKLLEIIPGLSIAEYPLLCFLVASALCLYISHRLFNTTLQLKSFFLPSSMQPDQAKRQSVVLLVWTAALYAVGWAVYLATKSSTSSTGASATTVAPAQQA